MEVLYKYLDLKHYEKDSSKWKRELLKSNKRGWILFRQLESMCKAFKIGTPVDLDNGTFLSQSNANVVIKEEENFLFQFQKNEEIPEENNKKIVQENNKELLEEMIKEIIEYFKQRNEPYGRIATYQLPGMFKILLEYRCALENALRHLSGRVLTASGCYYYAVSLIFDQSEFLHKQMESFDRILSRYIGLYKKEIAKSYLKRKYKYPDVDLSRLDDDDW